jgi:putative heme-binding domain-containing protein
VIPFILLLGMAAQTAAVNSAGNAAAGNAAGGNAAAGKLLFEGRGRCASCHYIGDPERSIGPDLGWIGIARTAAALRQSLVDPGAQVFRRYFAVVVETKTGARVEGLARAEDERVIEIRDASGQIRSFLKQDVKEVRREERSLMPSYGSLSPGDLDDLVAYLRTLRAIPPVEERERTRPIGGLSENVAFFNRPERDAQERSDAIVDALEIPQDATVADIGAGTGYFTWRLAQRVGPNGKVLAVDVQQKMLDLTADAVKQHGLANVTYVLGTDTNPRLPERTLDLVFIAYSYHEFAQPETTMAAIARSLKPGGRLFVLEFAKESRSAPAAPTHRMSLEEIRSEIEPLGFELDQMLDFLPMQHGLVYKRR